MIAYILGMIGVALVICILLCAKLKGIYAEEIERHEVE